MRKLFVVGIIFSIMLAACGVSPAQPDVAALEARVAALEAELGHNADGEHAAAGAFELAVAQYVMDIAGLHEIDTALAEAGAVDPAHLGVVNQLRKVLAQTPWPHELEDTAALLMGTLDEFAHALEADDIEAARSLAGDAHTQQHVLSAGIDGYLGQGGEHGH